MKTTESTPVRVDKDLKKLAHVEAIKRGTTLREILDDLLRDQLRRWKVL